MGKLTKAGYARAKSELGYKGKLTKKQAQRVFKRAIKKLGRKSSPSKSRATKPKTKTTKRSKTTKKGGKRMGGKSLQRTVFKWLRVGALLAPAVNDIIRGDTAQQKAVFVVESYTGYNLDKGEFNFEWLKRGWTPFIMATLLTYGIPKIAGIIRKL